MKNTYFMDIVINKEILNDSTPVFVAHCTSLGIASQGSDMDEAMKNIREAIELYLEEQPDKYQEITSHEPPLFSIIEVTRNAKTASSVG